MIQELFGSASSSSPLFGGGASCNGIGGSDNCNGDRKLFSITSNGGIILEGTPAAPSSSSPSPLPSPNTSSSSVTAPSATKTAGVPGTGSNGANSSSDGKQNLRCPRCDSSNTKFCYYNNYNLTQPRHFCKTCRRYWTKGGALRNVPIGGGCRKNKASTISSSAAKSSASKYKTISASGFIGGFDHELPSNPIMWGSPHGSHILALLSGAPHINPSPNPNPSSFVKEEVDMMFGGHVMTESASTSVGGVSMSPRGLGLDPLNHLPSIGLCTSFIRNTQQQQSSLHQNQAADHQSHQTNYNMLEEAPSSNAIHALYQRLKLSTGAGTRNTDQPHVAAPNMQEMANTSNPSSLALESCQAGVGSDQLAYWNNNNNTSNLCWLDLPTSNGPYP